MSLKVFISSKNRLQDDRAAAERAIADLGLEPARVDLDHGVATARREEWLARLEECDLVVMLLEEAAPAGDPREFYRYVEDELELAEQRGKPVLLFRRAGGGEPPAELVVASSLRRFPRRYETSIELMDQVRAALLDEICRRYRNRSQAVADREAFYTQAAKLVREAERRVYLGAHTPVVFFGPRRLRGFEEGFHRAMMEWIDSLATPAGSRRECVVFFSREETERELAAVGTVYDPAAVRDNLRRLDRVQRAGGQLHLVPNDGPHTFALFDDTFVMWLRAGAEWFGVQDESRSVCERLSRQVRRWTEKDLARATAEAPGATEAARWLARFEARQAPGGGSAGEGSG